MRRMSWRLVLPDAGIEPARLPRLAAELESKGYEGLWVGEVSGTDSVTHLSLIGAGTERVGLGTSIMPIQTRGPAVLAMTFASLARAFPSRVRAGLGVSSQVVVEGWNGIAYGRLLASMRDTIDFLRRAFAGEKIDQSFETFEVHGFRLSEVPDSPPPLLVAAAGPQMLDLARREADGVILNWCSGEDVRNWDGLPDDRSRVSVMMAVCPTSDRARALEIVRPLVTSYLSVPGYASQQRRLGRGPKLERMWAEWASGNRREALKQLPDEVLDELVIHGSPAECRERIEEFARVSGAMPLIHIVPAEGSIEEGALALGPLSAD
jgi:probable F420-dependent oxidoreductase